MTKYNNKIFGEWLGIINAIDALFEKLSESEFVYGTDSDEYKKYYDYLLIAMESEERFLGKINFDYKMYLDAMKYFSSSGTLSIRAINKINSSDFFSSIIDSEILDLKKSIEDIYIPKEVKEEQLLAANEKVLKIKKDYLDSHQKSNFFELINLINILSIIDSDLENQDMSYCSKIILITELKYMIIRTNLIAESIFLGKIPIEFYMARDDKLSAFYLEMTDSEFDLELRKYFRERINKVIEGFELQRSNDDFLNKLNFLNTQYNFRSIIFELGKSEASDIFISQCIEHNIDNPLLNEAFSSAVSMVEEDISKAYKKEKSK